MALVSVVIPVDSGFEADMQAFCDLHPLLTLSDIRVCRVSDTNGIYIVYDNTKEFE